MSSKYKICYIIIFEIMMINSQALASSSPLHTMVVLDASDKIWLKDFIYEEIQEIIINYQMKVLVDLPSTTEDYIKKLRECQDVTANEQKSKKRSNRS